jgi:hypothetical protein
VVLGLLAVTLIAAALAVWCARLAAGRASARREAAAQREQVRVSGDWLAAATSELGLVRRRLDELGASVSALRAERTALTAERDDALGAHDRLSAAQDRLEADYARLQADHEDAVASLARERERAMAAERAGSEAQTRIEEYRGLVEPGSGAGPDSTAGDRGATWRIVLANIERRWAAVVGATPDMRGVHAATVPDQLGEALARESERLREEVGVDADLTLGTPVEPADPVTFLLAASDLLGVLAATCERVVVALDGDLVLSGEGWSGATDELDLARARAVAAGVEASPISVDGGLISLTLHASPRRDPSPSPAGADPTGGKVLTS